MTEAQRKELAELVRNAPVGKLAPMPLGVQDAIDNDLAARLHDELAASRRSSAKGFLDLTQIVLA